MNEILAKAIRLAQHAQHTPRNIPIRDWNRKIPVSVTRLEPDPVPPPEPEQPPRFISVGAIARAVGEHYRLSLADMCSIRRTKPICVPRQVAMYLARVHTPATFPAIGRMLGGRDHTTVMAGYRKICKLLQADAVLSNNVKQIEQKLGLDEPLV